MPEAASQGGLLAAQTVIVSFLLTAGILAFTYSRLKRLRPGLAIGRPLALGFGLRLLAIAGVASTGLQSALRGGDELTFLAYANELAGTPLGQGFIPDGPRFPLHTVLFALQIKLGDFSDGALRITQVGIAMAGILLIVVAVHDLAGERASRLLAWLLVIEPASIFFNSALHKEPLMVLASGLVVFGGVKMWLRLDYRGIVLMALGGLIAVQTRPYAGWFLVSAGVLVILHASLRRMDRPFRAMPLVYAVAIAVFFSVPALVQVTSDKSLETLQRSQDANTDLGATRAGNRPNSNNLALEQVNFSTREDVLTNLPERMVDVIVRPYPWQVANPSQQLGAVGTLFALAGMVMLLGALWRRRGHIFSDSGPIVYPMLLLLSAYALSAGNAGTSFRYRTHLVTLSFAMMVVLRERARDASAARVDVVPTQPLPKSGSFPPWSERAVRGA